MDICGNEKLWTLRNPTVLKQNVSQRNNCTQPWLIWSFSDYIVIYDVINTVYNNKLYPAPLFFTWSCFICGLTTITGVVIAVRLLLVDFCLWWNMHQRNRLLVDLVFPFIPTAWFTSTLWFNGKFKRWTVFLSVFLFSSHTSSAYRIPPG